jgi:ubiquinone/menaquinone biosynthesis C-methylase UbiE
MTWNRHWKKLKVNKLDKIKDPNDIMALANAFRASRVFLTAFELDLFSVLGSESKTSEEAAVALKTDTRATDRLMNALSAIGLLEKKNGKFKNIPAAEKFLVKGKPGYMGGLGHTVHLWNNWSNMTESVKQGTAVEVKESVNDRGDNWLDSFIAAMHMRAKKQAPGIIGMIDLNGVETVLDVGGGPGTFSFAFADAKKGLKATVFDLPNVVPLTHKYIADEGFTGKVATATGDYLKDDLGNGYDLIFLSAVIHSNSADENKLLFSKCCKALNEKGQLVVLDYVMSEDRTSPAMGAMFALNMLVGTNAGDSYTESEINGWMKETGFTGFVRKDTEYETSLIIGRKV